jgi:type II secretory pathway pseudopilin PulG
MNMQFTTRSRGVTLLDALIALAVLAFGLLAIAKLHSDLLQSAAVSKARAEAVQLAETRIEEMRNLVQRVQFDQLAGQTENVPGINANFTRVSTVTAEDAVRRRIEVLVRWNDARDREQRVVLSSDVSWVSPIASLQTGAGGGGGSQGIRPPTGNARFGYAGEEAFDPTETGVTEIQNILPGSEIHSNDNTGLNDGTRTLIRGTEAQLVTAEGEVLLVMEDTSTSGQGFSVISGKVFFDPMTVSIPGSFGGRDDINRIYLPDIHLIPSDTSICTRVFANGVTDPGTGELSEDIPSADVDAALFSEGSYRFFYYQCYTGEAWYGNVGVVRLDSAALSHRLCVGDPEVSLPANETEDMFWHIPKLTTVRKYRGYNCIAPVLDADDNIVDCSQYESVGIGVDPNIDEDFVEGSVTGQAGEYTATTLINQYFIISILRGQPTDASCGTAMSHDSTTSFQGNSGEYFCLSGNCPGGRTPSTEFTLISGGATGLHLADPENPGTELTIYNVVVQEDGTTDDLVGEYCTYTETEDAPRYACTIPRPGWTGFGNWSGEFAVPDGCQVTAMTGTATTYTGATVLPCRKCRAPECPDRPRGADSRPDARLWC